MNSLCDIVVSAENTDYMAWQCLLFHYSCETHLDRLPIFVVHGSERELAYGYRLLEQAGGRIQRAPNFRNAGFAYPPRNTIYSLSLVETDAEYVALCDPDMLFLAPVDFDAIAEPLGQRRISFDRVAYLRLERGFTGVIREVCEQTGLDFSRLERTDLSGGVPHVVPNGLREGLCRDWLGFTHRCWEAATKHYDRDASEVWILVMWGLALAAQRLGIQPLFTELCISNFGNPPLLASDSGPRMIHYCYGDAAWSKRNWRGSWEACRGVWTTTAPAGTVNGAICSQLAAAAARFGIGPH